VIGVVPQLEHPEFDAAVRIPGTAFLATCPSPTSDQFKKKNFWTKSLNDLNAAYSGICAYTAMYLPDKGSVDHFLPKASHPHLAYEWNNFRLASSRVNNSKGNLTTIIDPFEVQDNWFYMDVPSCLIKSNPDLEKELRTKINGTINTLRLNDEHYAQERCSILIDYAAGDVTLNFLERRYPYLAKEIKRQGHEPEALKLLFRMQ
jgi:5-methylcytosine-specific restriction endonuclease McrA